MAPLGTHRWVVAVCQQPHHARPQPLVLLPRQAARDQQPPQQRRALRAAAREPRGGGAARAGGGGAAAAGAIGVVWGLGDGDSGAGSDTGRKKTPAEYGEAITTNVPDPQRARSRPPLFPLGPARPLRPRPSPSQSSSSSSASSSSCSPSSAAARAHSRDTSAGPASTPAPGTRDSAAPLEISSRSPRQQNTWSFRSSHSRRAAI